jgi:Fic family protein
MMRATGRYESTTVGGEPVEAFVPYPLPPADPLLRMDPDLTARLLQAESGLARLDLTAEMVPSLNWVLYAFVRKEAVLSSQIEGTQATLTDLLTFEATGREEFGPDSSDVRDVCDYIDALEFARSELQAARGLPISVRLLDGAHARLMRGGRGAGKAPGQLRSSQNWIGGTRPGNAAYVPPPPHLLRDLLGALERYIHEPDTLPPLVRAGLIHVHFESIHPYLDGNGRIGRLLIALLLEQWGLLSQPLLYLSLFFKRRREEYYRRLDAVRSEGDWEGWTAFFLDGVSVVSEEAISTSRDLFALVTADRTRVLAVKGSTVSAARLFELLPDHPVITVARAIELLETTKPTAAKAIASLEEAGVLVEVTGRRRDRVYRYEAYLDLLGGEGG